MRIDEGMILHSYAPLYDIPIIRSFLYGHKGMCEHYLKSASSSGDPFSEQSSSHTSRVLTRKNLHISRSHRKSTHRGDDRPMGNRKFRRIAGH